ncbi:MAG: trimethylamine methyltransferase family protein, partial [Anaerolineae bacterium]
MTRYDFAHPRMEMLSEGQCETIHRASLEILRRTGVRVYHDEALSLLRESGAIISDENLVRFTPGLVEWALGQAPSRIALCKRGSDEVVALLQGHEVNFGPGSDCLNYLDPRTGEHRLFTTGDVIDCIRVVDALPQLTFCMSMGIPSDLETDNPYRWQFAKMLQHTTKPIVFVCDDRADNEAIVAMAAVAAGGIEELRLSPTLLLYSEPSTPLKHSETATSKLLY